MRSILEDLGIQTVGIVETVKPFESWKESTVRYWDITLQMLSIGEVAEISRLITSANPVEVGYLSKIYLLAKALKSINGRSVVTEEELEAYNNEHNLTGKDRKSLFEYKVLFIRKLSETVVNRLVYAYDELQDKYIESLIGTLPDELKVAGTGNVSDLFEEKVVGDKNAATEEDDT